jgi:hypothetical protein
MNLVQIFFKSKIGKKVLEPSQLLFGCFFGRKIVQNELGPNILSHLKPTPFQSFQLVI